MSSGDTDTVFIFGLGFGFAMLLLSAGELVGGELNWGLVWMAGVVMMLLSGYGLFLSVNERHLREVWHERN